MSCTQAIAGTATDVPQSSKENYSSEVLGLARTAVGIRALMGYFGFFKKPWSHIFVDINHVDYVLVCFVPKSSGQVTQRPLRCYVLFLTRYQAWDMLWDVGTNQQSAGNHQELRGMSPGSISPQRRREKHEGSQSLDINKSLVMSLHQNWEFMGFFRKLPWLFDQRLQVCMWASIAAWRPSSLQVFCGPIGACVGRSKC